MGKTPHAEVHGRMRQRVVALRRGRKDSVWTSRTTRAIEKDKYLGRLLAGGVVTREELEKAVDAYSRAAGDFAWLTDIPDAILGRADRVFLARYGRYPTENVDFKLNREYHRICRSLQHDWHYYDADLRLLATAGEDHPGSASSIEAGPQNTGRRREGAGVGWGALCALFAGLLVALPVLVAIVFRYFPSHKTEAGLVAGGVWSVSLAVILAFKLRRRTP